MSAPTSITYSSKSRQNVISSRLRSVGTQLGTYPNWQIPKSGYLPFSLLLLKSMFNFDVECKWYLYTFQSCSNRIIQKKKKKFIYFFFFKLYLLIKNEKEREEKKSIFWQKIVKISPQQEFDHSTLRFKIPVSPADRGQNSGEISTYTTYVRVTRNYDKQIIRSAQL